MLTQKSPDGTWSVKGIDFKDCTGNMYGALCKLRDYEATGLEPDDFRSDRYEKKYLYKINYFDKNEFHTIYCETKEDADRMYDILKGAGFKSVGVNVWGWQAFIEE